MLRHDFDLLVRIVADLPTVNWHDLPLTCFVQHIRSSVVVRLTSRECRLILLQAHPGLPTYDPPTALLIRRLMHIVELKRELMRRLVDELRPAADEASLCALRKAVEAISVATGLEPQLQQAREDVLQVQGALWSLRSSAAEDRARAAEARARLMDHGDRPLADVEEEVRMERAESRAATMSETVQA